MSDETELAFANLEARAAQPQDDRLADRISLRDYVLDTEIGAFQTERDQTQRLKFNVVVEVQTVAGSLADDVDLVLSYDTITDAIQAALSDKRLNLLETLAERVAELILTEPRAAKVFVRIEKLDRGPFKLGVEIVRSRETLVPTGLDPDMPECQIVFVSQDMMGSANLGKWLDHFAANRPATVLVAAPDTRHPGPKVGDATAQRRIDLLHLDQAAWMLAAQGTRCVVADSRTEIDWAVRQGKLTVWAPSKLVLDATDTTPDPDDVLGLADWMAVSVGSQMVVCLGGQAPQGMTVPTTHIPADRGPE